MTPRKLPSYEPNQPFWVAEDTLVCRAAPELDSPESAPPVGKNRIVYYTGLPLVELENGIVRMAITKTDDRLHEKLSHKQRQKMVHWVTLDASRVNPRKKNMLVIEGDELTFFKVFLLNRYGTGTEDRRSRKRGGEDDGGGSGTSSSNEDGNTSGGGSPRNTFLTQGTTETDDVDISQVISLDTWYRFYRDLDRNGNNLVSMIEFEAGLLSMKYPDESTDAGSQRRRKKLLQLLDKDRSGELSFEEFGAILGFSSDEIRKTKEDMILEEIRRKKSGAAGFGARYSAAEEYDLHARMEEYGRRSRSTLPSQRHAARVYGNRSVQKAHDRLSFGGGNAALLALGGPESAESASPVKRARAAMRESESSRVTSSEGAPGSSSAGNSLEHGNKTERLPILPMMEAQDAGGGAAASRSASREQEAAAANSISVKQQQSSQQSPGAAGEDLQLRGGSAPNKMKTGSGANGASLDQLNTTLGTTLPATNSTNFGSQSLQLENTIAPHGSSILPAEGRESKSLVMQEELQLVPSTAPAMLKRGERSSSSTSNQENNRRHAPHRSGSSPSAALSFTFPNTDINTRYISSAGFERGSHRILHPKRWTSRYGVNDPKTPPPFRDYFSSGYGLFSSEPEILEQEARLPPGVGTDSYATSRSDPPEGVEENIKLRYLESRNKISMGEELVLFRQYLHDKYGAITFADMEKIFRMMDTNASDRLGVSAFTSALQATLRYPEDGAGTQRAMRRRVNLFLIMDLDGLGSLDRYEFCRGLTKQLDAQVNMGEKYQRRLQRWGGAFSKWVLLAKGARALRKKPAERWHSSEKELRHSFRPQMTQSSESANSSNTQLATTGGEATQQMIGISHHTKLPSMRQLSTNRASLEILQRRARFRAVTAFQPRPFTIGTSNLGTTFGPPRPETSPDMTVEMYTIPRIGEDGGTSGTTKGMSAATFLADEHNLLPTNTEDDDQVSDVLKNLQRRFLEAENIKQARKDRALAETVDFAQTFHKPFTSSVCHMSPVCNYGSKIEV
ncbi:unnamed protein product [Amoebophrya sp. A25]|nr:unnamed protein product [Amoebophrya sp. A25]|eukprot:GSA25T00009098001.1